MWMAASSPDAIRWSGEQGFSIMMDPHSSIEDIATKRQLYDKTLVEHGHDPKGRDIPVARLLAIAPTDELARRVAESGAQWTAGGYAKKSVQEGGRDPVERYVNDVILWGTPERVADLLLEYEEEKQLNYLLCAPLSHLSFQLFNDEVLPRLS